MDIVMNITRSFAEQIHKETIKLLSLKINGTQKKFYWDNNTFKALPINTKPSDSSLVATLIDSSHSYLSTKNIKKVKLTIKSEGFSFTVNKADEADIERMCFALIAVIMVGHEILLPLSKKVKPDWNKIIKHFPNTSLTKTEWECFDIHNIQEITDTIYLLLKK